MPQTHTVPGFRLGPDIPSRHGTANAVSGARPLYAGSLHDIAITNSVLCMAYKRGVGGIRILRKSWNSIAIVWAMQVGWGGGNKG